MRSVNRRRAAVLSSALAFTYLNSWSHGSPITFNGTYSQDFSSLPIQVGTFNASTSGSFTTGTAASATPTGTFSFATLNTPFDFDASNTSGGLGISQMAGFYGGASAPSQFGAHNGGTTKGGVIDFGMNAGVSTANQRFLGLLDTSTNTTDTYFGLGLVNSSTLSIASLNLNFTAALWRQTTVAKTVYFGYEVLPGGSPEPTAAAIDNNAITNIGSITFATGTAGPVDGTMSTNQKAFTPVVTIPGGVASGSDLYLEWYMKDPTGSGQGIGIGSLSLSATYGAASNPSKTDTWTVGAAAGNWDIATTPNWTSGGNTVTYTDGDAVVFPDLTGTGTINITATGGTVANSVSPASVTFQNSNGTYIINGEPITGSASLSKTGSGLVVINNTNTYSGGTSITGGTISIAADAAIGSLSSGVSLNGGTLAVTSPITSSARVFALGANGGTISIGANASTFGGATGTGAFAMVGTSTLTFSGGFTSGVDTVPSTGTLAFSSSISSTAKPVVVINPGAGTSYQGGLVLTSNTLLNVVGNGTATSGIGSLVTNGAIQVQASGAAITNASAESATIGSNIALNSTSIAFAKGRVATSPGSFTAGSFATVIGGSTASTGTLTVAGVISGNSDVVITNDPLKGGGSGSLILNQPNTYTGTTVINMNAGRIVSQADNALPATTDIVLGGGASNGVDGLSGNTNAGTIGLCSWDLSGHNQTISSISDGDNYGIGQTDNNGPALFTITNSGAFSNFTVSGSTNPYQDLSVGMFAGNINLIKGGTNSLVLDTSSTYTGTTSITGGTLSIGSTYSQSASPAINVSIASNHIYMQGSDSKAVLALYSSTALSTSTVFYVTTGGSGTEVDLDYSGQQQVFAILVNGSAIPNGVYSATAEPAADPTLFAGGNGTISVVPEPSMLGLLAAVTSPALLRRRRTRSKAI